MTCDACGKLTNSILKDYRDRDDILQSYLVCPECLHLNNEWFFKLLEAEDKEGILKELWELT